MAVRLAAVLAGLLVVSGTRAETPPVPVTPITVDLKQALPEEIFDAIAKQAGIKFSVQNNLWDQDTMQFPIDLNVQAKPFWEVVQPLCAKLELTVQNQGGNNPKRISLQQQGRYSNRKTPAKLPQAGSNGFYVIANSFSFNQTLNYMDPDNAQGGAYIQCMVYVDPAVRVVNFMAPKVDEATDDKGNSMVPDNKGNRNMYFGGSGRERTFLYNTTIPLKRTDQTATKITKLKFTLQCRAADKYDTLAVDKLDAKSEPKAMGSTTITYQGMKKSGDANNPRYEVKISMSRDEENNDVWSLLQTAQLLDEQNRPLSYNGGGSNGGGNGYNEYTITYSGDTNRGAPVKWMIEMPTETRIIKVPVELTDLALPVN